MSKTKYILLGAGLIGVLAGVGFGFRAIHGHKNNAVTKSSSAGSSGSSADGITLQQNNVNSISLNSAQIKANADNGLKVAGNSAATNLGQLVPPTDNSSKPSSPAASNPFDPTKFGQYDKYQDSKEGLFGEVQVGNGAEVAVDKKVAVYYKGWLTNGKLFDMSRTDDKGQLQPFVFTEGAHEVILGWEQALLGMKVGGVRLVIVPPAVGYGAAGNDSIPSNSVLVFQVQLVAVE